MRGIPSWARIVMWIDMDHLTEDELVLYRYQESPDGPAVARHLEACQRCQAEYAALDRVLGLLERDVPEPPLSYERDVWMKIAPRLTTTGPVGQLAEWFRGWLPSASTRLVPHLAFAATIALLLAGSFTIGRVVAPSAHAPRVARGPADAVVGAPDERDGVLLVAVGEHLQRSELMLTEFNNVDARGAVDLSAQQAWAEDLVSENRLYRQSAAGVGQAQMASLLDDLERVLLEVAHAPSSASAADLDRLRTRIDARDVLFKVRVAGAGLRAREEGTAGQDSPFRETGSGL